MSSLPIQVEQSSALSKHAARVDHLAIAVPDLEASIDWYTSVLGFTVKERRTTEGVTTSMSSAVLEAGALNIVLLQGTSPESQISRFIERYGPGVQHIAIRVDNLEEVAQGLTVAGMEFDTTIIQGGGLKQIFSKRDVGSGVMFELIERGKDGFSDQNVQSLFSQLEKTNSF